MHRRGEIIKVEKMALTSHSKQLFLAATKYILFMSLAYIGFSCDEKRQPYYKEACSKSTVGMDLESITDWDTISSGEIKINRNVYLTTIRIAAASRVPSESFTSVPFFQYLATGLPSREDSFPDT